MSEIEERLKGLENSPHPPPRPKSAQRRNYEGNKYRSCLADLNGYLAERTNHTWIPDDVYKKLLDFLDKIYGKTLSWKHIKSTRNGMGSFFDVTVKRLKNFFLNIILLLKKLRIKG